jgi:FkbM family methyltransferase
VRLRLRGPTRRGVLDLPPRDHITVAVQRTGTYYERDLLDAIRDRAAGGVYVDVGAHYGNHSLFFALECGAERVVAFEPHPRSHAGIEANARLNGVADRVACERVAIHPSARHVRLVTMPWSPRRGSAARSNTGMVRVEEAARPTEATAPAKRLDDALAPYGRVGLVKVDAEGLGGEILASGLQVLERDRPLLAIEAADDGALASLRGLLAPLGYAPVGRYCWTPTYLWCASRP